MPTTMTEKELILNTVQALPDEIKIEEVMEKLYFLLKVEKGISQADSNQSVTHEEAKKRLDKFINPTNTSTTHETYIP